MSEERNHVLVSENKFYHALFQDYLGRYGEANDLLYEAGEFFQRANDLGLGVVGLERAVVEEHDLDVPALFIEFMRDNVNPDYMAEKVEANYVAE